MSSLNKATIIGHLGQDPVIRSMQNGGKVASLSVATSESWKSKDTGDKQTKTEWHRVTIFNEGIVGVVEKYLKKGSQVYLEGQLETRKYTDKDGVERYSTEIVLKPYRGELTMLGGSNAQPEQQAQSRQDIGPRRSAGAAIDDEIQY